MKPNFPKKRAGALVVATLMACASVGCASRGHVQAPSESTRAEVWAGTTGQVTIPAAPALSSETQRLTFLFSAPAGYRTAHACAVLRETLAHAGYRLTLDPKKAHEARIDARFEPAGDTDAIELTVERDGRQIESIIEPFAADDVSMRAELDQLVTRLTLSPRLALLTGIGDADPALTRQPVARDSGLLAGSSK